MIGTFCKMSFWTLGTPPKKNNAKMPATAPKPPARYMLSDVNLEMAEGMGMRVNVHVCAFAHVDAVEVRADLVAADSAVVST